MFFLIRAFIFTNVKYILPLAYSKKQSTNSLSLNAYHQNYSILELGTGSKIVRRLFLIVDSVLEIVLRSIA